MKTTVIKVFLISLAALSLLVYTGNFIFSIIQNNIVNYEERIDNIDPDTGDTTYILKVKHWKKGEIIRDKFYFDLSRKQIDSIKIIEDKISEKYKLLYI